MPGDAAGNTLATARWINADLGSQSFGDRVESLDPNDYYRFSLSRSASLSLSLQNLTADANLQLLNSQGALVQASTNTGASAEAFNAILNPGTYYIRVLPTRLNVATDYTLNFNAQSNPNVDLLWRDYASGANAVWFMGGSSNTISTGLASIEPVGPEWQMEAIADFNRDGTNDILWREYGSGITGIWLMGGVSGTTIASIAMLPTTATSWQIEGIADFNQDGVTDIIWRDYASGANGVWLMGGTNNTAIASIRMLDSVDTTWRIEGAADFNRDGQPDLLWRDAVNGFNGIWFMGGTDSTQTTSITLIDSRSTNWAIEGVVDFNQDGAPDIFWRDYATGNNEVWLMGGEHNTTLITTAALDSVPPTWQAIPVSRNGQPPAPDLAGNTPTNAFDIGALGIAAYRDSVGLSDPNDYYRFTVTDRSTFNLSLRGLTADADVQLLNANGTLIQPSANPGILAESINRTLDAGTYLIRIFPYNQSTPYTLNLSANPISTPTTTVNLTTTDANAAEVATGQPQNPGQFTLTRTGNTNTALTINYTLSGTATNGTDFNQISSIVIPVGQASVTVPITVIDDGLIESGETVILTLNSSASYNLGTSTSGTVTIVDNDVLPTVAIAVTDGNAVETRTGETANPGQFTLTRTGSTSSALTINYTIGGSAISGTDFSSIVSSITIPVGQSSITIPVNVIDDSQLEGNETVTLTLSSNSGYIIGSSNTGTVAITDDPLENVGNSRFNPRDIGVLGSTQTFRDRVDSFDRDDYYSFSLTHRSTFNLQLDGIAGGTYIDLLDEYGGFLGGSYTFSQPLNYEQELLAGTYYVRLFFGNTNYTLNLSATPISTLPAVTLSARGSDLTAVETASDLPVNSGQFVITRAGDTTTALTVDYSLTGTATNGSDFVSLPNRITIPAGQTSVVIPITAIDDAQSESSETIILTLISGSAYTLGSEVSQTLRLVDNDAQNGSDDTMATARNLGSLGAQQVVNDRVDNSDRQDNYVFTLTQASKVNLTLSGLTSDADLSLIFDANQNAVADRGSYDRTREFIARSLNLGSQPDVIDLELAAGTYYIAIDQEQGNTNYTLTAAATPLTLPASYHYAYGYGMVDAAAVVAQALGQSPFAAVADLPTDGWALNLINAPEVWAQGYTGQGVIVAVVDSSVNQLNHPDLKNNIWVNSKEIPDNSIDDDNNGFIDDVRGWDFIDDDNTSFDMDGHGTHVAGIIAGENNGFGVTGVAPSAKIMPIRVLDDNNGGTWSQIAAGIRYAANNGAQVINLSLGGEEFDLELQEAVRYAVERGAVVVMASGNESQLQPGYPAEFADLYGIAVGAVDSKKTVTSFSNGAISPRNFIVAPGDEVFSTYPIGAFESISGTSMATPMVAGVAALLLSAKPTLTQQEIINLLVRTANPNGIKTA